MGLLGLLFCRRKVAAKEKKKKRGAAVGPAPDDEEANTPAAKHGGEGGGRRRYGTEFWDLVVFLAFVLMYGNYLYMNLAGNKYYLTLYLENALTLGEWYPKKTYMTILTNKEYFTWLVQLFIPMLYPTHDYYGREYEDFERRYMGDQGPLKIGLARFRMLRMKDGENCAVPSQFEESCLNCVGPYNYRQHDEIIDKDPHGGTEYVEPPSSLTGSPFWSVGAQQYFGYGGHTVLLNYTAPRSQAFELKRATWIDRNTRGVWTEFTLYTPAIDTLTIVQISMIFTPTGGLIPEYHFYHIAMRDVMFLTDTAANKFYFFNLMVLNVYIIIKFAYECHCVRRTKPKWYSYFGDPYRNIEFVNLVFFMVTVMLRYQIRSEFAPLQSKFGDANEYVDALHLRDLCLWCDRVNAINAILSVLKFFKYVRFSAQLTLPVDVLMLSMTRMAVLSIVIGILLVGYAVSFDMMFGFTIEGYRSFSESLLTLVKCVFGDFSFEELLAANRYMGPLLLISFWLVIYLIVLSMFFAMVSGAQDEIMDYNESTVVEHTAQVVKDMAHAFSGIAKVLRRVPVAAAFVPSHEDLMALANEPDAPPEAEAVDGDGDGGGDDGGTAEPEEPEEELDPFFVDDDDLRRAVADPSVVVLERLNSLAVGQKEITEQMKIAIARRKALNAAHRLGAEAAGGLRTPNSRPNSRGYRSRPASPE